jgi:CRISPR/Cas system endoribonuclease Cas6 (RAMP superfamily)
MYFVALLLTLRVVEDEMPLTLAQPHDISYALMKYLCRAQGPLHEEHLTVAVLKSNKRRVCVRLTVFGTGERAATALHEVASQGPLQLGQRGYEVESIDPTHTPLTGIGSWADILSEKTGCFIRFSFVTPLITAEPEHGQDRNALPFPEPLSLFLRLGCRWQQVGGPLLPADVEHLVRASDCVVSSYRLHTVPVDIGAHALMGYLGWLKYECRKPDHPYVASLNGLARLAFFTGTGYFAAQGMGVTFITLSS